MVKEIVERIDPNFDEIIQLCIKELKIKFKNYGNTWLELDDKYYKERLMKEVKEYVESMTIESEKRKLLNIINIAAMAHETASVNRRSNYISVCCPNCNKSLLRHNIKDGEFKCVKDE